MALSLKRNPKFPPRPPRYATGLESSLFLPDNREVAAYIRNLSEDGVMAEICGEVVPDTDLGVSIPDYGIVRARVRWSHQGWMGARFLQPINIDSIANN